MVPRLFTPLPLTPGATIQLDQAAAHHAVRVLRLRPGDAVELFDGDGHGATAILVSTAAATVRVDRLLPTDAVPPLRLTLAQCLSASDKMDWTIEKAVELGATALVPLQSDKAIVKLTPARSLKRREHWQRLILAACAQSGRNRLPRLEEVASLGDWLADGPAQDDRVLRILLAPGATSSLVGLLAAREAAAPAHRNGQQGPVDEVWLLCGPEAGLSPGEVRQAGAAGWLPVSLGPRVLRTETAGLAALAVLQSRWGDLR